MKKIVDIANARAAIDFRPKWRISMILSLVVAVISVVLLLVVGLNLSNDFEGGVVWEVPTSSAITVDETRAVLGDIGDTSQIQFLEASDGAYLRVQAGPQALEQVTEVTAELADLVGFEVDDVTVSTIGPTWGARITSQALRALVLFFIVVALYIAWRLEWRMAIGALLAVVHDLLATAGVYSLFQFTVSPATVIALLTILGYSLYDTVVVYDKVLENQERSFAAKQSVSELVNHSMNQVLMRSINTTITTVLPVGSMLIIGGVLLGGASLMDFALALFVGLILGAYSSVFLAAPLLVLLRERSIGDSPSSGSQANKALEPVVAQAENNIRLITPGGGAPRPRRQGKRR